MGPLDLIRRLFPAAASASDEAMYARLLKDADARSSAINEQIRKMTMKATDQERLLASPKYQELERRVNPINIARDNLRASRFAAGDVSDDAATMRLLLATDDPAKRHLASLLHRGTRYHLDDKFLPETGVYIEGLSSEVPGGGTQMLKQLEAQYPGAPMYLESVGTPATKEFYLKKGFMPQPEGASKSIPSNLFVKPAGVQVKREGGLIRYQQGGKPGSATDRAKNYACGLVQYKGAR